MTRIVFVTQTVDPEHPWLGAAVPLIAALSRRVDEVVVLAQDAVEGALPANCRVRRFGAPSRVARGLRFTAALRQELRPRPLAVLAHQIPVFAVLAAPLVRPRRIPLLLWYTSHWETRTLRVAERAVNAVLTVDRRSFRMESRKVVPIGHGIDLERFACVQRQAADRLRVLALGRTSPSKGLETVVRAAQIAGADVEICGPSLTAADRAVRARVEELGATVTGPLPHSEIPALLAAKDVLVSNMREGSLDKVVYEAAATCMPVLACNAGFDDILLSEDLIFHRDDTDDLAARLTRLAHEDRNAIGSRLRSRVTARHSVEHWADEVLRAAAR